MIMSKSEETMNTYVQNCIELKDKGIHKAVVRFAQIDTFHVCMEMLLTVYIIEMVVLLTDICSKDPDSPIEISPFVVFLPFIIAIVVALFCIIWALWYFRKKANEYLDKYFVIDADKPPTPESAKKEYEGFIEEYKNNTGLVHVWCTMLYLVISFVIARILEVSTDLFNQNFVGYVIVIAVVLGALWNWAGYYRHQRILWCRFFPTMRDRNNTMYDGVREKDVEESCLYHKQSIKSIVCTMGLLLILFTYVVINFHPEDESISIIGLLNKGYGTLFIPFFTLAIAYVKFCYSISFDHNDDAIICHSLEGALSEHPAIIEKEQKIYYAEQPREQKFDSIVQKLGTIKEEIGSVEQMVNQINQMDDNE